MNKVAVIVCCLGLFACAGTADLRPEPYLKSESLLQQGLTAYENDDFLQAQEKFKQALEFYQSFDNQHGMALARLNLAETALALSDFNQVEHYLTHLKQQPDLKPQLQRKIIFLTAKLQLEQQQYLKALQTLQPLLESSAIALQTQEEQLNVLALQAKLELLTTPLKPSQGVITFSETLAKLEPKPLFYQMLLKRLLAIEAMNRGDYNSAKTLFLQALEYYRTQAQRRSIAACLEELADLENRQNHPALARDYLQRALVIRQWLKNEYKSKKIRRQLEKKTDKPL